MDLAELKYALQTMLAAGLGPYRTVHGKMHNRPLERPANRVALIWADHNLNPAEGRDPRDTLWLHTSLAAVHQ